jgi:hypothetical protein
MAELACVRGPDPLLEDRAQSHGSSPFGDQSSGVTARSREIEVRCRGSVHPLRDASSSIRSVSRSPDPFGCPSRSSPRSPHGGRGRLRFFHSGALERGSIMPAFRRSRSFRFDHPLGGRGRARSFSSHLSVQKVRSAFTPASAFVTRVRARSPCGVRARSLPRSPRGVRACSTITHLTMDFVPASAFASRCPLASSGSLTLRRSSSLHVREQPRSFLATFHVRSPYGARTLPSSMLDLGGAHVFVQLRHLTMPSLPAFVIASRRSCSRSHA